MRITRGNEHQKMKKLLVYYPNQLVMTEIQQVVSHLVLKYGKYKMFKLNV